MIKLCDGYYTHWVCIPGRKIYFLKLGSRNSTVESMPNSVCSMEIEVPSCLTTGGNFYWVCLCQKIENQFKDKTKQGICCLLYVIEGYTLLQVSICYYIYYYRLQYVITGYYIAKLKPDLRFMSYEVHICKYICEPHNS